MINNIALFAEDNRNLLKLIKSLLYKEPIVKVHSLLCSSYKSCAAEAKLSPHLRLSQQMFTELSKRCDSLSG
ncbi:MAG: hypothetical protein OFPI_20040 [Osedax symbiont Rs2]|nr:MAG: hypothetical protein OFPI_20040 [Osedax symbiont Rs2]